MSEYKLSPSFNSITGTRSGIGPVLPARRTLRAWLNWRPQVSIESLLLGVSLYLTLVFNTPFWHALLAGRSTENGTLTYVLLALLHGLAQDAAQVGAMGGVGVAGAGVTPSAQTPIELALTDLPLIELSLAHPSDTVAILYSGDGGWRDLDKQLAAILQQDGLPVVGVDVLRYFWKQRDPAQCAQDLGRIIETYRHKWGARKVVLIGYSFGADVLPALYNRLAPSERAAVVQISLLGFAASADFEVTVAGWLQQHSGNALPTLPEVRRIAPQLLQCFYGEDDDDSACTRIGTDIELIRTTGSHHFDGDYPALARRIMQGLQQRKLP